MGTKDFGDARSQAEVLLGEAPRLTLSAGQAGGCRMAAQMVSVTPAIFGARRLLSLVAATAGRLGKGEDNTESWKAIKTPGLITCPSLIPT